MVLGLGALLPVLGARVLGHPVPLAVGFEVTHRCNLSCSYCDRHTKQPKEMSLEQSLCVLGELQRLGMRAISLDGGEALTCPHIDALVEWLLLRKVTVRLNTNGWLVPQKLYLIRHMEKVKISLDGPEVVHDKVRGSSAFRRAIAGVEAARAVGTRVELTCALGSHNAAQVDEFVALLNKLKIGAIFQPVRDSLFIGDIGPGARFRLEVESLRKAFARVEYHKRRGAPILNTWASLRHFRHFPEDVHLPCAAGWLNVTLDPEGNLYACGQSNRSKGPACNVLDGGVKAVFERLVRQGCEQCWCARVVEENYAWGGRFDQFLPSR